jgi:hypothetical protein
MDKQETAHSSIPKIQYAKKEAIRLPFIQKKTTNTLKDVYSPLWYYTDCSFNID